MLLSAFGADPAAGQAAAQRGPALNWVRSPGAESCIGPVDLAARVEQRLGRNVFVPSGDALVVIEGFVSPQPRGFSVMLRVSSPDGEMTARVITLEQPDCRKLDELAALVIAVTIHGQGGANAIALPSEVTAELDALFVGEPSELDPPATLPPAMEQPPAETPATPTSTASSSSERAESQPASLSFGAGADCLMVTTGLQPNGTLAPIAHVALRTIAGRAGGIWIRGPSVPQERSQMNRRPVG